MNIRSVLDKEKLVHSNFLDWHKNLRILLKQEKRDYVLENPIPNEPTPIPKVVHDAWLKHVDDFIDVSCLMLSIMIPYIQQDLKKFTAYDMIKYLKQMFGQQARTEMFETFRSLHGCKMEETGNVSTNVLKMKSHIDQLERLGSPYTQDCAKYLIMNSLPTSYDTFIMN